MVLDLHIHTTISGDSTITPETLIAAAKNNGLDGVCITEHGNRKSTIAGDLSRKYDFPVFGGMEASTELGDLLVFGVDSYPKIISKARDLKAYVDENGGVLIAAHPFRKYFYRSSTASPITLEKACQAEILHLVDAMEKINGWATEEEVSFCQDVSDKLGLIGTGSSDAHIPKQIGSSVTIFENPIKNEAELVAELKRGRFIAEDRRRPEQKNAMNWFR